MSRSKSLKRNARAAAAMAALIAILAMASWVYYQQIDRITSGGKSEVYRNVTLTDALLACREFTEDRYQDRLKRLTFDSHSSRWENREGQYKIFFKASIQGRSEKASPTENFVSCDVSGRKGVIRDFDIVQERDIKNEAKRLNDGGMFGWP